MFYLVKRVGTFKKYLICTNQAYFDKHLDIILNQKTKDEVLKPDAAKDQILWERALATHSDKKSLIFTKFYENNIQDNKTLKNRSEKHLGVKK